MTQRTTLNGFEYVIADGDQGQLNILGAAGWEAVGAISRPIETGIARILFKRPISYPTPTLPPAELLHLATEARRIVQWVRNDYDETAAPLSGAVGYLDRIIATCGGQP